MEAKSHLITDPDVQRLGGVWTNLMRVERALSATAHTERHRAPQSLPAVLARLGGVLRSHMDGLGLEPQTDWAALADDLGEAEQAITRLVEELLWLLDCAGDLAATLAGRSLGGAGR